MLFPEPDLTCFSLTQKHLGFQHFLQMVGPKAAVPMQWPLRKLSFRLHSVCLLGASQISWRQAPGGMSGKGQPQHRQQQGRPQGSDESWQYPYQVFSLGLGSQASLPAMPACGHERESNLKLLELFITILSCNCIIYSLQNSMCQVV